MTLSEEDVRELRAIAEEIGVCPVRLESYARRTEHPEVDARAFLEALRKLFTAGGSRRG